MVRLDSVVRLEEGRSPSRVDRYDRQRQANLRSGIQQGYGLADRLEAVRGGRLAARHACQLHDRHLGRGKEFERTIIEFGWAFLLSVVFMYMVLAAQYESLLNPLIILLALPLSLPVRAALDLPHADTLNLYSALGMLVLFGVVAKNAILQIDHTLNLRRQGRPRREAILEANRDRLRPILMTTLALVGGMLPLAIGSGPGRRGAPDHRGRRHRRPDPLPFPHPGGRPGRLLAGRRCGGVGSGAPGRCGRGSDS